MKVTQVERMLLDLPTATLRRVLIDLIRETTVEARGTYEAGGEGLTDPALMRNFNEAMHRLAAALAHCEAGQAATAVEMVSGQLPGNGYENEPVGLAVRRALDRALHRATAEVKESP